MTAVDQTGDLNLARLHAFAKQYPLPEFAKEANFATEVCNQDGPRRQGLYADVRDPYQFPLHTKAATFFSTLYFLESQPDISPKVRPRIATRLQKAAEHWGISKLCNRIKECHTELTKVAELPDSAYAIVWATEAGTKERHYPMRNALEVKAAARWYCGNHADLRKEYNFTDRQTFARKIMEKAGEFGADIKPYQEHLERCSGQGVCSPKRAALHLRNRTEVGRKVPAEVTDGFNKLAEMVEGRPNVFLDPDTQSQLAESIDQFDRTYGLTTKYSSVLPSPEEVVYDVLYSQMDKIASTGCETVTGSTYSYNQFEGIKVADMRSLFGNDIADEVASGLVVDPQKMAEIVATLPRTEATMLDDFMSDRGCTPLAKTASSVGFANEMLEAIAAS